MGKLFKISGSFEQNGTWPKPRPAFVGEIVVGKGNMFCGYCDELYEEAGEVGDTARYLIGTFIDRRDDDQGIEFYKLSNHQLQLPLLYRIENLATGGDGTWSACMVGGRNVCFMPQGDAQVSVEEKPCSKKDIERVKTRFSEVREDLPMNRELLQAMLA